MLKTFKISMLAILSMAFVFSSCKKEEDNNNQNQPKANVVSCKINGNTWNSLPVGSNIFIEDTTSPAVSATLEVDTFSLSAVSVNGKDTSLMVVSAVLNSSNRVGTYGDDAASVIYFPALDFTTILNIVLNYEITSSVTITKFDAGAKKISGTYTTSMTTTSGTNYEITSGEFNDIPVEIK